jgi:6-phosphofructokinase
MMGDLFGNLLIAQGGGPTAVINASLQGVIEEAKRYSCIQRIYGAIYGVEGVLKEQFVDLGKEPEWKIRGLQNTPASALGSCRKKLTDADMPKILETFKKYDIRYFLYNGGNDSMDTCNKIFKLAKKAGYEMRVLGIPKTIDNDLAHTDHSPGFGSAARYAAVSVLEVWKDIESLPIHVCVMELMGRNAGWLTASSVLAKKNENCGPHLVYLPERPFNEDDFLEDVKIWHQKSWRGTGCCQ